MIVGTDNTASLNLHRANGPRLPGLPQFILSCSCTSFSRLGPSPISLYPSQFKMASSILRGRALGAVRQTRCFSSTPRQYAADVKSVGVLGAGQMVRALIPLTREDGILMLRLGPGHRSCCCAKGAGSGYSRRCFRAGIE